MISVATLDPATLALWFNPTAVAAPENGPVCNNTFELACGLDLEEYQRYFKGLGIEQQSFSANIASALWHEKRHFLDLVLTNYGAYRARQFFMVACNAFAVLKQTEKQIAFPIRVHSDRLRRRLAGLSEPSPGLLQFVEQMNFRQDLFSEEGQTIEIDGHQCEIGGDAQLEALAFYFQMGANQEWLGLAGAEQWQKNIGEAFLNPRYRWAELVGHEFGLIRVLEADVRVVDYTLLVAVLFASLMSRAWNQGFSHPKIGNVDFLSPIMRLSMLLEDAKSMPYPTHALSEVEAFRLVNMRCKTIFGRTVFDELNEDYKHEEEWIGRLSEEGPGPTAFRDFHRLRGEFIELLQTNPEQLLGLRPWSRALLPKLQPLRVIANSSGVPGEPPPSHKVLFEGEGEVIGKWWWASIAATTGGKYATSEIESWSFVLQYLAPLTKLMLAGRRNNVMIGPELVSMEHELKRMGFSVYIERPYEFPDEGDDTRDFFRLSTAKKFRCDFCAEIVSRGDGKLLGPWAIRRNAKLIRECIVRLGGSKLALELLRKDWSHWHTCERCVSLLKKQGAL